MTTSTISVRDAIGIAYKASRQRDTEAPAIPIPVKVGDEVQLLVMFFGPGGPPPKGYKPPKFAVFLTLDGKVLNASSTSGHPLGSLSPNATQPGLGFAELLPIDDAISNRQQFEELSPKVWQAYAAGRPAKDPDVLPLVAEYWRLFNASTANGVAPFYMQASPAFFAWVRSAEGVANF